MTSVPHRWIIAQAVAVAAVLGLCAVLPLLHVVDRARLAILLHREDGPYEMLGALGCLAAAVTFFYLAVRLPRRHAEQQGSPRPRWFLVLLAIALFVMFGEEISWGQRVFGFATPEWFEQSNIQAEFNLHNLRVFHPQLEGNWLKLAWLLGSLFYLGILPPIARLVPPLQRWLDRWGLPLATWPLSLGAWAATIAYFVLTARTQAAGNLAAGHSVGEAVETAIELMYFIFALGVFAEMRRREPRLGARGLIVALVIVMAPLSVVFGFQIRDTIRAEMGIAEAQELIDQARQQLAAGDVEAAETLLVEALRKSPHDPEVNFYLGAIHLGRDDADAAEGYFTAVLSLDPHNVGARNNLAIAYVRQGRLDEAEAELMSLLVATPEDPEVHNNLGYVYLQQGRAAEAAARFEAALKIRPDHAEAQQNLRQARAQMP